MEGLKIVLSSVAMFVHTALVALGNPAILCLEADGHMAFEDGNAPCCRTSTSVGTPLATPVANGEKTLASTAELPCDQCLDIELAVDSAGQCLAAASRDGVACDLALPLPGELATTLLFPRSLPCPLDSLDPGGGLRIAHLRTVVLRC